MDAFSKDHLIGKLDCLNYIMPRMPMIGRPRAIQTTMCMTVMIKPIFHHSPWPMKPEPKKIGVTPQP